MQGYLIHPGKGCYDPSAFFRVVLGVHLKENRIDIVSPLGKDGYLNCLKLSF